MSSVSVLSFYILTATQRKALGLDVSMILMPHCYDEWGGTFIAVSSHAKDEISAIFSILFAHSMNNMSYKSSHAGLEGTVTVHLFKFTETGVRNLRQYVGMKV